MCLGEALRRCNSPKSASHVTSVSLRTGCHGWSSAAISCFPRCAGPSRRWAGKLSLIATFPDRPPVELSGIADGNSRV